MKKTFYVTTAIDYVNAEPHIGHAYQKIIADVLARWHRLLGQEVFFVTGTDEHGRKVQQSAIAQNLTPKEFVDLISLKFKEAWKSLNISYDRFIRTTDEDHKNIVQDFLVKCNKSGDIYLGVYKGYYCLGCEAYYSDKDVPDLVCPIHKRKLDYMEEDSYFFRLSKYQDFLIELYKKNPEMILPEDRRKEILNRINEGLKDFAISRTSFDWGIQLPFNKKHVTYVWFDALINYYTATQSSEKFKKFWPADLHILGKDNMWFHCVYWPAMLKSAGLKMPKTIFNHGFLTFNGQRISKSLGNVISPKFLTEKYGADSVRYFSLRQFSFAKGDDGDFEEKALIERHNNELANKLGNLISRVSALAEKYGFEKTEIKNLKSDELLKKVTTHFEKYELDKALNEIFSFVDKCNEYVQSEKPWETRNSKSLYELANAIKDFTILLYPFIPESAEKISKTFNFKIDLKEFGKPLNVSKISKSDILFKKI